MSVTNRDFNPSGNDKVTAIKQGFTDLELIIKAACPDGRRKNIVLTELETAAMYAVKSIFEG